MKIEVVQRNYIARDKLLDLINKKLQRFEKYLTDSVVAKVVLSKAGNQDKYKMEISIKDKNLFVRSEVQSDNMYVNLDTCLAKIERQVVRMAGKFKDSIKNVDPMDLLFVDDVPEIEPARIVKTKEFELDILSEDQAVDQLELIGNDFYIYRDNQTGLVNVLYRRADGNYGLIRTR